MILGVGSDQARLYVGKLSASGLASAAWRLLTQAGSLALALTATLLGTAFPSAADIAQTPLASLLPLSLSRSAALCLLCHLDRAATTTTHMRNIARGEITDISLHIFGSCQKLHPIQAVGFRCSQYVHGNHAHRYPCSETLDLVSHAS